MRIWKTIPVMLALVAGGCSEAPTENKDAEKENAPAAESPAPVANTTPEPADKPAEKPAEKPADKPAAAPAAAVVIPSKKN